MSRSEYTYRPAWWVPGAHLQTLWGKLFRRTTVPTRVEVWRTPDDDSLEIHRLDAAPDRPRLFLLHGLEGSVRSHYVGGFLSQARARGWGADLLIFRGCGSAPNAARRFYHSGETSDLSFALTRVMDEFPVAPIVMAGVSLGGNVLLKWLGEMGDSLPLRIRAAAAVSVPYDLARGARYISQGFSRVYESHFVSSLRRKAAAKRRHHPDVCEAGALERVRTIWDFDDVVTAPVHGFRDAADYYAKASSLRWLSRIRRPTLLLSAADDPFLPPEVLDDVLAVARKNDCLVPEFHRHGGHVGFVEGVVPFRPAYYAELRVAEFLAGQLSDTAPTA